MTAAKHFSEVCREGYSVLGRTGPDVSRQTPWQYGAGYPPSYEAFGRLRFLKTLELAKTINAKRVLEVAAGDGFLSACLVESGRHGGQPHATAGQLPARVPGVVDAAFALPEDMSTPPELPR